MHQEDSIPSRVAPQLGPVRACVRCGAGLDGVDSRELCPECRESAASSVVAADRSCAGCGYNLRGLPVVGVCPECGTQVRFSLRGSLLRYGSAAHLRMLHLGAVLVELSTWMALAGVLVIMAAGISGVGGAGGIRGASSPAVFTMLLGGFGLATCLVGVLGWWLVGAPDPALTPDGAGGRSRRVLRATVAVQGAAAVLLAGFAGAWAWNTPIAAGGPAVRLAADGLVSSLAVSWVVSFFAAMVYVRRLATRVPDWELAGRAGSMITQGGVIFGGIAVLSVLGGVASVASGPLAFIAPVVAIFACFMAPVLGVMSLVAFITYITMVDRLRSELNRERQAAKFERAILGGVGAEIPS